MNSRERILSAISGLKVDHVPLTTWAFGVSPPARLRWKRGDRDIKYWYSQRMEHIHTLPHPWTVEDDFERAKAWLSMGADDLLDVSVPWSQCPDVRWRDSREPAGSLDARYPVLVREYETPAGSLRHAVTHTGDAEPGWVIQPEEVRLFEDYNIPRGVKHAVAGEDDVGKIRYLYAPPDDKAREWLAHRVRKVAAFAKTNGVAVQAWSAFGMDAAVWLAGTEGAVMLAMDHPEAFGRLVATIAETDLARTELAAATAGVDIVAQRGWYSSTDFWSPALFDKYVYPHVHALAGTTHGLGKKFAYCMTTGVETLGPRLVDAGVDLLYFIDPVQDRIAIERAGELLGGRIALAGGLNSVTLGSYTPDQIRAQVLSAVRVLGPTNRFILHPVDALFPDTPWSGVETMMEAWKECR